jgi:glycosyltransferase involved in cell wall biosynthesis
MDWAANCAVVIPCFNEARTIGSLVTAIRSQLSAVWIVDDGSSDATVLITKRVGGQVACHSTNLGKGAALQTGLAKVAREGFSWALTMDGDGQHSPADIPILLRCAEQTGAVCVVGNRMSNANGMPWHRHFVNRWMSQCLSRRTGVSMPDSQCGFRLVCLKYWTQLKLQTQHFETESEMLLAFANAGLPLAFAPVRVSASLRPSRIRWLVDTWRWFYWWWHTSHNDATDVTTGSSQCLAAPPRRLHRV